MQIPQQWQDPSSGRDDGSLYHLLFESPAESDPDRTYFKDHQGAWFSLSPISKAETPPVAIQPI